MTPELWRNYGTSHVKKTEVEVLPVVDLSGNSAAQIFFFVGDATQVVDIIHSLPMHAAHRVSWCYYDA